MEVVAKNWDNKQLVEHLVEGDQLAFEFVVRQYSGDLLQRAFQWTKDQHQAADLVQDVLLDLWERHSNLQVTASLQGYLYSMLKHRFLRLVSRSNLHEQAMSHLLQRMDQLQSSILDVMAASDLQQTLSAVVDRLPENMRKIFVLRNEDYTLREIAQALGLAEQTVKSYHSELNRRIKEAILAKHPDISHSLLVLIIAKLMEN
ncbi:RNA polymerase sigma factor [Parapedobacter koreensis]|uniref:RNA polymerase sigma-70 factor, ECF subfamily n=1 Tax=Parapedobacter koreensis TaxID=332977 RepID=A0A1H7FMB7_9SPHI|nr:sigma-70 family RNA polymerase sigma factor [Parapedobacter koreensis]SEK27108.1 RNA polymerase sigma-70 factor, ECF subfamily [Parapedobacter koreensis]